MISGSLGERAGRKTETPEILAPLGTPGDLGVLIPDCRKPVAGECAVTGWWGVTGKPVAESGRRRHGNACE